tara:strand:+ start:2012 stop:3352 length:1341 start_codon:yes stop_codon:yes gene_type:complete
MSVSYPSNYERGALNPFAGVLGGGAAIIGEANTGNSPSYLAAPFLLGVVLYAWREEVEPDTYSESDPLNIRELNQETVFVKVRIPEIQNLPIPRSLPTNNNQNDQGADWDAINRYPSFQASNATVIQMEMPQPGEVVMVDFRDRVAKIGPIYLGPMKESVRPGATPFSPSSASQAFSGTTGIPKKLSDLPKPPTSWVEEFESGNSNIRLISPSPPYLENRVRVGSFASLPKSSPLLEAVPGGALVHKLLAARVKALNDAWVSETGRRPFTSSNGWRSGPEVRYAWLKDPSSYRFKRFKKQYNNAQNLLNAIRSGEKDHYKLWIAMLLDEYDGNLKLGKVRRAWNSPHQTGLAIDFNNNGLSTQTKRVPIKKQRASKGFKWLQANAHKYGIHPYEKEPWHWECMVPRDNFVSGEEFAPSSYDVRVVETNKTTGKTTAHHMYASKRFT